MKEFLETLFSSDFEPHGYCYLWNPGLVGLHVVSDALIALAYFSIPVTLIYFIRKRRDLPFNWMFVSFGMFILACGATHIMEVWTLWHGIYWLSGSIKAVTAMASVPTAILLVKLVPEALALPSPEAMKLEIAERKRTEQALHQAKNELELRVLERTAELRKANEDLVAEIAQRKQIEDVLREREGLIHAILDNSPALIFLKDMEERYLLVNKEFERAFEVSQEEIRGKKDEQVFPVEQAATFQANDLRVIQTGVPMEFEEVVLQEDRPHTNIVHRFPLLDLEGKIYAIGGIATDITERKRAEDVLRQTEAYLAQAQRLTHVGSWALTPPYWSQESFEIFGLDPAKGPPRTLEEFMLHVHPDDRECLREATETIVEERQNFELKFRIVRPDGEIRVLRQVGSPVYENRLLARFVGAWIDITEQEQRTEELRRSEFSLAEGQRLVHMGSWSFTPDGICDYWSRELFDVLGFDPSNGIPTIPDYLTVVHPDDREFIKRRMERMVAESGGCDEKYRILHPQRGLRFMRGVGIPVVEDGILIRFIGTTVDITEEETLTQELKRSEAYLAEAQSLSQTGSFGWSVSSGEVFWSEETFRIFEYDRATKPSAELVLQRVHPEDKTLVQHVIDRARQDGKNFDLEHRLLMPDGSIKYLHVVAHGIKDELDQIEFVGAVTDITATKIAEQRIQQDERELRQLIDFVPQHILVARPDGTRLYANQGMLEYYGMTLQEVQAEDFYAKVLHPDDLRRVLDERQSAISAGTSWEAEARLLRKDGQYRWFLIRSNPLRNEQGGIIRRYTTATDIEDRKQAEEKVQRENVALREEIDKASMFEEIVGSSEALRKVLSQVAKVAPTDSTVLLTGETGTGKELIARAIHKRSRRSSRAFVSVNCAAIPQSLIGSELFGHEKGAFTGAIQRRLGRFELAEGGTIFLDEIGELPSETQNALLRVLQEREFERVGGARSIRADVRVIAATNRNLKAAIAARTFREDLFYRLAVFPIEIPPLRERREDIPMLVEYFIDRYAKKVGKKIRGVNEKTLELLCSYPWPGNIRELQNVIERSVIVCETENFAVDESWLSRESVSAQPASQRRFKMSAAQEKEMIEAALAETRGRVSGPSGGAAKLGIPPSTLDSKIKSLKIDKDRFKPA